MARERLQNASDTKKSAMDAKLPGKLGRFFIFPCGEPGFPAEAHDQAAGLADLDLASLLQIHLRRLHRHSQQLTQQYPTGFME
jgi:hypothetical protein